jgi:hypothetical protein
MYLNLSSVLGLRGSSDTKMFFHSPTCYASEEIVEDIAVQMILPTF